MEKLSLIERLAPAANTLIGRRGRIAFLMASLAAPTACSVTASFSFNADRDPMDAFRNGALNRGGAKAIDAIEAGAGITLGKVNKTTTGQDGEEKIQSRIDGLLLVHSDSPLRHFSEPRVYSLAEEDAPWVYLVHETPNTITLRTKCDTLVLKFNCGDLTNIRNEYCSGNEVSSGSINKVCANGHLCDTRPVARQEAGAPDADINEKDAGAPDGSADAANESSDQDVPGDVEVTPGEVIEVDSSNFQQEILDVQNKPTLLVFYVDGSQFAQAQIPILEEIATELGDNFVIAKVNANENPDLATQYGVQRIPDSRILMNGSEEEHFEGLQSKEILVSALQRAKSHNKSPQNNAHVVDGGTTVIHISNTGVTETTK